MNYDDGIYEEGVYDEWEIKENQRLLMLELSELKDEVSTDPQNISEGTDIEEFCH
ncbi:hypothetical protein J1N35_043679, partial [Gossypium stocksii]